MTAIAYPSRVDRALEGAEVVLVLVPEARLREGWLERAFGDRPWRALLERAGRKEEAGRTGKVIPTVGPEAGPDRLVLGLLPDRVSRHNAPSRADFAAQIAGAAGLAGKRGAVLACLEDPAHALPLARAVARALPLFQRRSNGETKRPRSARPKPRVSFVGLGLDGRPVPLRAADRSVVARARWAASMVDTPTEELSTAAFEKAIRKAARGLDHVRVRSIVGADLLEKRLGGIHAVGRAAKVPPRLVLLEYRPPKAKRTVGLVGKGVVYDTGGLSLKPTASMSGMKADMGGAAAVVAAALSLAESRAPVAVVCAAPLAENAIGPGSYRPDDILTFHSGKTVEINNTDAEGRLLLADAVSYVARRHRPDVLVDAATLTGAQLVSTGVRHAAVVSNREGMEKLAVEIGRASGDLTAPLPFAPEFFQDEFKSKVADMRNSVANRMNAQTSCAAQFVYAHIEDLDIPWLHVDLAGPAFREERGTGYGVALLARFARAVDEKAWRS